MKTIPMGGFLKLDNAFLLSEQCSELTHPEFRLIIYLNAHRANSETTIETSVQTILKEISWEPRAWERALAGLVTKRIVAVARFGRGRDGIRVTFDAKESYPSHLTPNIDALPVTFDAKESPYPSLSTPKVSQVTGKNPESRTQRGVPVAEELLKPKKKKLDSQSLFQDESIKKKRQNRPKVTPDNSGVLQRQFKETYEKVCKVPLGKLDFSKEGPAGKRLFEAIQARFPEADIVTTVKACVEAAFELAGTETFWFKQVTPKTMTLTVIAQQERRQMIFEYVESNTKATTEPNKPRVLTW